MCERFHRWFSFLVALVIAAGFCSSANAALKAVGPVNVVTTLPSWYQDPNNLALEPCLDQNGFCILTPPFDPAVTNPVTPITTTGPIADANFPNEIFYFIADAIMTVNGGAKASLRLAMEAAFLTGVTPNTGITFLRVNLKKMSGLTPNSIFTVTHPYGTFQFSTDGAGNTVLGQAGQAFRTEDPIAPSPGIYFPPAMQTAANTHIGPFLTPTTGLITDPITGHQYIGNPATPVTVTGSPNNTNFFRIDGPNIGGPGVNTIQTNLFAMAGRVFTGPIASPLTVDRVTYARDANTQQIDAFITALPAAVPVITGTGIAAKTMTQDIPNSGKFFANIPVTLPTPLPPSITITNNLDVPPTVYPVNLVDEVNISAAEYNPVTKDLTIKAASRDKVAPLPTLSLFGFAAPNTFNPAGTLVVPALTIPPETVTVVSSKGGSATVPVSVVTPPPMAVNDTAVVAAGGNVVINVLANDSATAPATISPTTVQIASTPSRGSATVNPATGAITYTPTGLTAGTDSFTYTFADSTSEISNAATVTITIIAAGTPPVAVADTATTLVSSAVTINVIGNDTPLASINPASLVLTTPTGGTAVANANGTVTYTAPATPGTYTFAYTLNDTSVPPVTSNPATVTVTVTGPNIPPVAANDTAATILGVPVSINVIANDTSATSTINPATVVVTPPTGGTAVANIDGTVTYTPPALAGTYTFTYTVKDRAATPATSNIATVTVTVAAANVPPVAGNDSAATVPNGVITINVIANDTSATSTINPASLIVSPPTGGTAVANANGTVTYTAPVGAGTYTFAYTVKDNATPPATSNPATVTVTVTAVNVPPVAANDTATATTNGTATINVIANDTSATSTINPASVVVTVPTGGTAVANPNGTVTYTAPGIAGTYTFTYTVKDNAATPATSNVATVTVTVTAPAVAPVAGNDSVTMTGGAGTNTIINVLANDSATLPATINTASVVIVIPPANGTAVVNAGGTVTYTPAAGFVGTNTFTYTVRDSAGTVSNTATVTITVQAPNNESLVVTLAQFFLAGSEWRVEGTTTARTPGETITIYNGATVAGSPVVGTATVVNGVWKFGLKPGPAANNLRRISIQSSLVPPAIKEGITLTVR